MPERVVYCCGCGRSHSFEDVVPRAATCEGCAAELRVCLTCRFHDASAYNECAEPSAERVVDKGRANFCDYYAPGAARGAARPAAADRLAELEKAFKKS